MVDPVWRRRIPLFPVVYLRESPVLGPRMVVVARSISELAAATVYAD